MLLGYSPESEGQALSLFGWESAAFLLHTTRAKEVKFSLVRKVRDSIRCDSFKRRLEKTADI